MVAGAISTDSAPSGVGSRCLRDFHLVPPVAGFVDRGLPFFSRVVRDVRSTVSPMGALVLPMSDSKGSVLDECTTVEDVEDICRGFSAAAALLAVVFCRFDARISGKDVDEGRELGDGITDAATFPSACLFTCGCFPLAEFDTAELFSFPCISPSTEGTTVLFARDVDTFPGLGAGVETEEIGIETGMGIGVGGTA